jgi:hypothetical protein
VESPNLPGLYRQIISSATADRLAGKWDGVSKYGGWRWDIPELIEILEEEDARIKTVSLPSTQVQEK